MFSIKTIGVRQWLWICAVWGVLGFMEAVQTVFSMYAQGMHHSWVTLFLTLTASWVPWALATPLIFYLGTGFRSERGWRVSTWALHLITMISLTVVTAAWQTSLEHIFHPWAPQESQQSFLQGFLTTLEGGMVYTIVLYAMTLTAGYSLDSRLRLAREMADAARLNEQLSLARLDALRQQIEPHFIFNALNASVGLIREDRGEDAVRMIVGLSEFLRRVSTEFKDHQVALSQEMEFLERYLDIQKVRFADRLQITLQVPAELLDAKIPTLLLQPLVENALKHGIGKRIQGGAIRVLASHSGGRLRINIYNDGPLLKPDWEAGGGGIGLANLRARLSLLYGKDFELSVENHGLAGVEALVSVPYRDA